MRWTLALCGAALLAGCTSGQTLEVSDNLSEEELIARSEHSLGARIKEQFGPDARIAGAAQQGKVTVLNIAKDIAPADSDAVLPVAIAVHDPKADALTVPAATFEYKEARVMEGRTALLKASGELELIKADGSKLLLADRIRGDVQPANGGALLATQKLGDTEHEDTRVVVINDKGETKPLVDGEGDRATMSPDGQTVVFISGRSGVASFYVTNLAGAAPQQVTNTALVYVEDQEPTGFVPVPVNMSRVQWLDKDTLRFDAGGNELWTLNIRTKDAAKVGGAQ